MTMKGGCLCEKVRYEASEQAGGGHCHCIDCRKTSGTGHASHMIVPEPAFKITGEVKFFDKPADSGNIISRGFCPECGSPVYSKNSGMTGLVFVRASSLDDPDDFTPELVVYTKREATWDKTGQGLPHFTDMPSAPDMPENMKNQ